MSETFNSKGHWDGIYETKQIGDFSWYQAVPSSSLESINELKLSHDAKIIDAGGGDTYLVDYLLEQGYNSLTVLDISSKAIARAKERLGKNADKVEWVVSNVIDFHADVQYDLWHDRAAFHFLTQRADIKKYVEIVSNHIKKNGYLLIATFSENGPKKCSGIEIKQYSLTAIKETFQANFDCIHSENMDHTTPSGAIQNFSFCVFQRK